MFGFSKLDVMFGRTTADAVLHPYRDIVKPGVRFVQATITVDRSGRASGSRPTPARSTPTSWSSRSAPTSTRRPRPGCVEGGHEFYTEAGAFALRDVLAAFDGGRVIVGVTSTPFKCPPAPSETALLMHDLLATAGRPRPVRDLAGDAAAGADPAVAGGVAGAARGVRRARHRLAPRDDWCASSTPPARSRVFADGSEMPYDLFLGVPVHRVPPVVVEARA